MKLDEKVQKGWFILTSIHREISENECQNLIFYGLKTKIQNLIAVTIETILLKFMIEQQDGVSTHYEDLVDRNSYGDRYINIAEYENNHNKPL